MQNLSCIDLLLINNAYAFRQTISICTVLSDCNKLVLTLLKAIVPVSQPKEITYRDYKQFDSSKFKNELKNVIAKENTGSCSKLYEQFFESLKKSRTLEKKLFSATHALYISKTLRKAIIKRSVLSGKDLL